jgi:hypothetical protein
MNLATSLERIVPMACTEVFAAYGVSAALRDASAGRPAVDSDVHCGGLQRFIATPGGAGSALLVAPFEFLSRCGPPTLRSRTLTRSSASDWILVRDWSMELANQVVGRVKNRLLPYGVTLQTSCPTAVSGHPLALATRERSFRPYVFAAERDVLSVWFWIADAAVAITDPPKVLSIPQEGNLILF